MAQPSRFSADVTRALLAAARRGESRRAAAKSAGVTHPTLYAFLRRGDAGEPGYAEFAQAYRAAEVAHEREVFARASSAIAEIRAGMNAGAYAA